MPQYLCKKKKNNYNKMFVVTLISNLCVSFPLLQETTPQIVVQSADPQQTQAQKLEEDLAKHMSDLALERVREEGYATVEGERWVSILDSQQFWRVEVVGFETIKEKKKKKMVAFCTSKGWIKKGGDKITR